MIAAILVVAGYGVAIYHFGWIGVAATALHIGLMLLARR